MSKTVEIGDHSYKITHPDPEIAWEIGIEFLQIAGESLAIMGQAAGSAEKAADALPQAIKLLLQKISPKRSREIAAELFRYVEVQGPGKHILDKNALKLHFQGRAGDMMRLFGNCIEFQFEDFFKAIMDGIAGMKDKA